MKNIKKYVKTAFWGVGVGVVNGVFGAGGGMVLVPMLTALTDIEEEEIFPASISVMLPVCVVSLIFAGIQQPLPWKDAFPYLIGSAVGGMLAGWFGKKIPTAWLHRGLGLLIIWGGIRYLC